MYVHVDGLGMGKVVDRTETGMLWIEVAGDWHLCKAEDCDPVTPEQAVLHHLSGTQSDEIQYIARELKLDRSLVRRTLEKLVKAGKVHKISPIIKGWANKYKLPLD